MTPEDIAKQRHHHDIVELLTDWSLTPVPTSPPAIVIHNGNGQAMVDHVQAARPKTTAVNKSQATRRQRAIPHGKNNNNTDSAERKRKKARTKEEPYPVMTSVPTLSPTTSSSPTISNAVSSCATKPSFSPNCVPIANGLSPLGSAGISPANLTTFSPVQAPNWYDTQAPPSPREDFWPEELDNIVPFDDSTDISLCGFPPNVTAGNLDVREHTAPTTSDCMTTSMGPYGTLYLDSMLASDWSRAIT